jgi:hypothetical protein
MVAVAVGDQERLHFSSKRCHSHHGGVSTGALERWPTGLQGAHLLYALIPVGIGMMICNQVQNNVVLEKRFKPRQD